MKKIKNLILLMVLSTAFLSDGCKKEKAAPAPVNINANVNGGSTIYFNTNAMAVKGSQGAQNFTVIQGRSTTDDVNISITLYGELAAGKTFVSGSTSTDNTLVMGYTTFNDGFFNDYANTANPVTVTITSISSTSIQGTFKGQLTDSGILSGTPMTVLISGGQFSVAYQ